LANTFLTKNGFISKVIFQPRISNMVVILNFGNIFKLEDLSFEDQMMYEQEQFLGVFLKVKSQLTRHRFIFLILFSDS
jgi:TATA-box binding protein (TBP) (component of TFIID and TFIIIB)